MLEISIKYFIKAVHVLHKTILIRTRITPTIQILADSSAESYKKLNFNPEILIVVK